MTKRGWIWKILALVALFAIVATACGDDSDDGDAATETTAASEDAAATTAAASDEGGASGELTPVSVQLQWFTQAQFAGYYAAKDLGFYEDVGLDVTLIEGGVDIVPATVLDAGGADFAVTWLPRAMAPIEEGADITNIAQVFQRSATTQVAFADRGITTVDDLAGTNVGNWGFGNEYELLAGLRSAGLDPDGDVTLVQQAFDMQALISGEIDAAQAMIYNEYAQVLETVNPDTGELFQPEDLVIIDWNDVGTAMLQDGIWAQASRLDSDSAYRDQAVRFVEASLRGWAHCRDDFDECVQVVLDNASTLGQSHQTWQLNEINALIWPSPGKVGILDEALWQQSEDVAIEGALLSGELGDNAFRTDIAEEAVVNLEAAGVDVVGDGFTKVTVELLEGGN